MVRVNKESKETKQLKKALAALDTAVQKWYERNVPQNKERYASCHIRTYYNGSHVSNITLNPDPDPYPDPDTDNYIDIKSSKEKRKR